MKYLLRKGGYYYRPHSAGYTGSITHAGIFDEGYALSHAKGCDEVSAIPVTEIAQKSIDEMKGAVDGAMRILTAIAESAA
jgi:hypothetical protein